MESLPKIIQAKAYPTRIIEINYDNGMIGTFNFETFFDYLGYYDFLKDLSNFQKIKVNPNGHFVFWLNDKTQEEIELDPAIMYSICFNEKIIHETNIVFDPSLGKNAWIK